MRARVEKVDVLGWNKSIMEWAGLINFFSVVAEVINLVSLHNGVIMSNLGGSGLQLMGLLRFPTAECLLYLIKL